MSTGFVFPGQGSQAVGMGRALAEAGVDRVFGPGTTIAEVAEYLRANARPRD